MHSLHDKLCDHCCCTQEKTWDAGFSFLEKKEIYCRDQGIKANYYMHMHDWKVCPYYLPTAGSMSKSELEVAIQHLKEERKRSYEAYQVQEAKNQKRLSATKETYIINPRYIKQEKGRQVPVNAKTDFAYTMITFFEHLVLFLLLFGFVMLLSTINANPFDPGEDAVLIVVHYFIFTFLVNLIEGKINKKAFRGCRRKVYLRSQIIFGALFLMINIVLILTVYKSRFYKVDNGWGVVIGSCCFCYILYFIIMIRKSFYRKEYSECCDRIKAETRHCEKSDREYMPSDFEDFDGESPVCLYCGKTRYYYKK
ncbi:MAG: hypothetical protein J6Y74_01890 [Clostridia bacterium]|nr:hypothetical protein [Clostridia bacterium]